MLTETICEFFPWGQPTTATEDKARVKPPALDEIAEAGETDLSLADITTVEAGVAETLGLAGGEHNIGKADLI